MFNPFKKKTAEWQPGYSGEPDIEEKRQAEVKDLNEFRQKKLKELVDQRNRLERNQTNGRDDDGDWTPADFEDLERIRDEIEQLQGGVIMTAEDIKRLKELRQLQVALTEKEWEQYRAEFTALVEKERNA